MLTKEKWSLNWFKNKALLLYCALFFADITYKSRMSCTVDSRRPGIHVGMLREENEEEERHVDRFYCARMQAEESLGVQCTCSGYIELHSRAPPSPLQQRTQRRRWRTAGLSVILLPATTPPMLRHLYCPYPLSPSLNLLLPPFYGDCASTEARQTPRRRTCSCTTQTMMNSPHSTLRPPYSPPPPPFRETLSFSLHKSPGANYSRGIDDDCFAFVFLLLRV